MSLSLSILTLVALAATCALVGWFASRDLPRAPRALVSAGLMAVGLWTAVFFVPDTVDAELREGMPMVGPAEGFASSAACRACHPGQYDSWHDTFHRTMTQVAGPDTVLAPFDGRTLQERGRSVRVLMDEGRYYVESGRSGKRFRVVLLTGSHHLQAFWIQLEDGRLSQVPFVYLIEEERWLANSDSFLQPEMDPGAPFEQLIWGEGCVNCHSTGGPWDPASIQAHVRTSQAVTELGIACEACHGQAQEHADFNRDPRRRYALHAQGSGGPGDDTIVNPRRIDAQRSASICGRCHTVAEHLADAPGFLPGGLLSDTLDHPGLWSTLDKTTDVTDPTTLTDEERDLVEAFWRNGTVRVVGREYDGMVRSACYLEDDLSCVSCHRVHGGTPDAQLPHVATGVELCGSCHETLFADVSAHTHHAADSAGSECVSCHMPYSTYGLLMATRSHRLDSPIASGFDSRDAPNACNLCHQDQSLGWTAERLEQWYQRPSPPIPPDLRDVPAGALWLLRGDAVQRAIAAWHLRQPWVQDSGEMRGLEPALVTLLADPVSAVRQVGGRTLELAHPDWGLDLGAIAADPQTELAIERRSGATGLVERATFERLVEERIDLPVSIPE